MSTGRSGPGLADQTSLRSAFRVGGVVCLAVGLILVVAGCTSFARAWDDTSMDAQPTIWPLFVGLPLTVVGGWLLKAGFLGAGVRYVAGEVSPVAGDTLGYLGVGGRSACSACGTANAADAAYCDNCGAALRRVCPACKRANESTARFCAGCGASLPS